MATVITAPQQYYEPYNLFIAGGITDCPDWQKQVTEQLIDIPHLVMFNPRRHDFDVTDKNASRIQIEWEYEMLANADGVLFWFPCETLCPITLLEFGKIGVGDQDMFVGCHLDYRRIQDVRIQLGLMREHGENHVLTDLDSLVESVRRYLTEE